MGEAARPRSPAPDDALASTLPARLPTDRTSRRPDRALGKHAVLVERDELAEHFRRQRSARMVFEGRLPGTLDGNQIVDVPSALTCSRVLAEASASVCAKTFAAACRGAAEGSSPWRRR